VCVIYLVGYYSKKNNNGVHSRSHYLSVVHSRSHYLSVVHSKRHL